MWKSYDQKKVAGYATLLVSEMCYPGLGFHPQTIFFLGILQKPASNRIHTAIKKTQAEVKRRENPSAALMT